jgi:hypothetical protein
MSAQDFQSKVLMDSSLIDMASYVPDASDASSSSNGNNGNGNTARADRGRPGNRRMLGGDNSEELQQSSGRKLSQIPTVVDWVAANKVTAVKDQGSCGEWLWWFTSGQVLSSSAPASTVLTLPPHSGRLISCRILLGLCCHCRHRVCIPDCQPHSRSFRRQPRRAAAHLVLHWVFRLQRRLF